MKTLRTFFSSLLIVGLSGFSLPSFADDTELYIQKSATVVNSTTRPNLLFIVDNSGSMMAKDTGDETRIQILTNALTDLINGANSNINIGLGRLGVFGTSNTPVVYGVTPINAPVLQDVIAYDIPIQSSADDAEEGLAEENVITSDKNIEMTNRKGTDDLVSANSYFTQARIKRNSDDAEELLGSQNASQKGTVRISNFHDIALGSSTWADGGENIIGLRFEQLGIPSNATITSAYIEFTARSYLSTNGTTPSCQCAEQPINLQIQGLATDNLATFSNTTNKVSSATPTNAAVKWNNVEPWVDGKVYRTPDLSDVVQEIVSRTSWADNNGLGFRINRFPMYDPTHPDYQSMINRQFYDYSQIPSKAPILKITYSTSSTSQTGSAANIVGDAGYTAKLIEKNENDAFEFKGDGLGNDRAKASPKGKTILNGSPMLGQNICEGSKESTRNCYGTSLFGFRFEGLDIPKDAKILKAALTVAGREDYKSNISESNALGLKVYAEKTIFPSQFDGIIWDESASQPGTGGVNNNISSRIKTDNFVDWTSTTLPAFTENVSKGILSYYATPDLKTIIQEVVNQKDWKGSNETGYTNNALVLLFDTATTNTAATPAGSRPFYDRAKFIAKDTLVKKDYPATCSSAFTDLDLSAAEGTVGCLPPSKYLPKLEITWIKKEIKPANQLVGFRFQDVGIPRGATVKKAYLTLTSGNKSSVNSSFEIKAEKGDSQEYQEIPKGISTKQGSSGRVLRSMSSGVAWNVGTTAWESGVAYNTPDLTSIVQEVVNDTSWCGGNSLGFTISSTSTTSLRNILSYDSDPVTAPVLHVEFDPKSLPTNTCVKQTYSTSVIDARDDGIQTVIQGDKPTNNVFLTGIVDDKTLNMSNTKRSDDNTQTKRVVGLRFQNIPLKKGANILKAELVFTGTTNLETTENVSSSVAALKSEAKLNVYAQKGNASSFKEEAGDFTNATSRPKTTNVVPWIIPSTEQWADNKQYRSPDLKAVVQEIIGTTVTNADGSTAVQGGDSWELYGNMAFFISASDDVSLRKAASFDQSPTISPILKITVDVPPGEQGNLFAQTARQELQKIPPVLKFGVEQASGRGDLSMQTPIVDALYEGAMYYAGKEVTNRGNARTNSRWNLVSNPNSHNGVKAYTNSDCNSDGTPKCPAGYTSNSIYNLECASEHLASAGSSCSAPNNATTYKSPVQPSVGKCQATNHIILLSDGIPTFNNVAGQTKQLDGFDTNCAGGPINAFYPPYETSDPKYQEIKDLSSLVTNADFSAAKSKYPGGCGSCGPKNIVEVSSPNDLKYGQNFLCGPDLAKFISTTGVNGSTVKVHTIGLSLGYVPKTPPQQANSNVSEEKPYYYYAAVAEAYLKSLAKAGNGSYYRADTAEQLLLAFNTIIKSAMSESSSFASPAISVNVFNRLYHNNEIYFTFFKPSNKIAWDGNVKRYNLCTAKTGCASSIVGKDGTAAVGTDGAILSSAKEVWSTLSDPDGAKVLMAGAGGVLPAPDNRNIYSNVAGDEAISLSDAANSVATGNSSLTTTMLNVATEANPDTTRTDLINWIRGYEDVATSKMREWRFGDPLHSTPGVFTYGKETDGMPKTKVIVNTNEGAIRMLDGKTGVEDWMFIPRDMLAIQKDLKKNPEATQRLYGIDGRPVVWVRDNNYNGIIESANNDSVWVFTGMRRGGRNIYAMDVTPDTANPPAHKPRLMWTIFGGQSSAQGDFSKLGQTWSTPIVAKVLYNGAPKTVLLFAGGFDATTQDVTANYQQQASMGNAIYMVDPLDGGKLLWTAGNANNSSANLKLTGMNYSFPSDLTIIDGDGDGLTDRIYVGDTGGQLWRIDIRDVGRGYSVGGRLAILGDSTAAAGKRRFFYAPDVARLTDVKYSPYATDFDLVLIGSGYRPNPLDKTINDRLYAFRDRQTGWLIGDGSGGKSGNAVQDTPAFLDQTVADGSAPASTKFFTITEDKLYDATTEVLNTSTDVTVLDGAKETIQKSLGWKVDLKDATAGFIGEKALAKPLVLNGIAYYTTFVPPQPKANESQLAAEECKLDIDLGKAKSYAINILTGEGGLAGKKRAEEVGGGIPAEPIAVFTENGVQVYVSTGSGDPNDPMSPPALKPVGPGAGLPRETVYWIEE